jgi:ATP phosphoribosyltransferase
MIRIAVPNKGSLSDAASGMLREAGYKQRLDNRDLILIDSANNVEFYFLRPRDIALYVGSGELDAGITGRDLLNDSETDAVELLGLNFGNSTFRFAKPIGSKIDSIANLKIATSYPALLGKYLESKNISAQVIKLDGAVETSVKLGVADVIADVVSTGTTLRQAGLEIFDNPIFFSEAILIGRRNQIGNADLQVLIRRLQGVVIARQYILMDYDVPNSLLVQACELTPGIESPTVSPLQASDWSAVRAMVKREQTNDVMDKLWELGARGILVTDIHACRL